MFDFARLKMITFPFKIETEEEGEIELKVYPPTVQDFKKLTFAVEYKKGTSLYRIVADIYSNNNKNYKITPEMLYVFTPASIFQMAAGVVLWLNEAREEHHLNIPHFSKTEDPENTGYTLPIMTFEEKIIRDYSGLSFREMESMNVFEFWQLLRDAVLCELKKTPGGREMMEEAYCFEQTEPDREALTERGMRVAE